MGWGSNDVHHPDDKRLTPDKSYARTYEYRFLSSRDDGTRRALLKPRLLRESEEGTDATEYADATESPDSRRRALSCKGVRWAMCLCYRDCLCLCLWHVSKLSTSLVSMQLTWLVSFLFFSIFIVIGLCY